MKKWCVSAVFVSILSGSLLFGGIQEQSLPYACPFPGLKTRVLQKESGGFAPPAQISFVEKDSKLLLKKRAGDPEEVVRVLETKIDGERGESYFVDFSPGPSVDPSFQIFAADGKTELGVIEGDFLMIPGNGFLYSYQRSDRDFLQRRKYRLREGKVVEVLQPFLFVGLEGRALKEIVLLSQKGSGERVATIAKGDKVFVVLNDGGFYLVKTKTGLLGWVCFGEQGQQAEWVEGLFFAGD